MGLTFEMFPNLTNLSLLLATILLLLTLAKGEEKDFCCKEKMVGTTNYTLQPNNHHQLPLACLDNCVYTVANTSTPKYCFEKGDLPTKCLSDTTTTTTTTPTTTTTTTTTVPKGVVSSPNFPNRPPSNLDKEYTIEVEQGLVLRLEFTEFYLDYGWGYIEKEGKYGYVCDGYSMRTSCFLGPICRAGKSSTGGMITSSLLIAAEEAHLANISALAPCRVRPLAP